MAGQHPYGQQWPGQQPPQYGQPQMGHPQQFGQPMHPGQMQMMPPQGGYPMMHPGQMQPGFGHPMPGQFPGHPGMHMPPGSMPMQYGHPGMPMPPQGMPFGAPPAGMPMPPGMPPPPQGGPPGAGLGLPAPPAASGAAAPPPLPHITDPLRAWVGKFPEDMDDGLLQRVLAVFGPLRNWKRGRDPDTDETKGFGFAEWASPFALLNATRVLHGLPVSVKHSFVVKIGQSLNGKLQEWNEANRKALRAKAAAAAGGEGGDEEEGETGATVQLPCPDDVTEPWRWLWRVTTPESEQVDELGGKVVDCMQKEASGAGAQVAGEGASKAASGRAKMEQLRQLFAERCGDAGVGAAVKRVIPSGEAGVHVPQINEGIVSAIGTFREDAEAERAKARKAAVLAARERARRAKAEAEAAAAREEGANDGRRSRSRSPPTYGGRSSADRSGSRDHRSQDRPGGERHSRFDRGERQTGGRYESGASRRDLAPRVDDRFVDDGSDDESSAPGKGGRAPVAAEGTARAASSAARALEGGETIKIALGGAVAPAAQQEAPSGADGGAAPAAAPSVTAGDLPPPPDSYSGWQSYPLDKLFQVFRSSGEVGTDAVKLVVSEQLTDLLGEDEPTLQGYVMSQVAAGVPAGLAPVRAELALVLDDDADEMLTAVLLAVHAACK